MRFDSNTVLPFAATPWLQSIVLLCMLVCASLEVARADEVYVVCNTGVSLRATDVRELFTGEKGFAGSVRLAPADNGAVQAAFLEKALKLNASRYASLWTKKAFRDGANPPLVKNSDAEALAYVMQTPGGCSYVGSAPPATVATVAKF